MDSKDIINDLLMKRTEMRKTDLLVRKFYRPTIGERIIEVFGNVASLFDPSKTNPTLSEDNIINSVFTAEEEYFASCIVAAGLARSDQGLREDLNKMNILLRTDYPGLYDRAQSLVVSGSFDNIKDAAKHTWSQYRGRIAKQYATVEYR